MSARTSIGFLHIAVCLWVVSVCHGNARSNPIARSTGEAMRDDARLADVMFVDPENGWAVGDRGVILHTADGGKTWDLQNSGVECPLASVQFVDKLNGWAAGGWTDPWLHTSRGVMLRTRDGGRTWRPTAELLLPRVRRIKFFDVRRGWAMTQHSEMFPVGAFLTTDGGRTWAPVSGNQATSWQAADFFDKDHGAALSLDGTAKLLSRQGVEDARSPGIGRRVARSMRVDATGRGWLVGDRGLVMQTTDRGLNWQTPAGSLPPELASMVELAAIAGGGDQVWLAGTPGTRVLHSADAGRTWQAFNTGQRLPIHGMYFVDPRRGWAVGELGTILATRDGGRSWTRQREGGNRAAYMTIFAHADEVPLELLAQLSIEDGYLGTVQLITSRASHEVAVDHLKHASRAEQAVIACGASSVSLSTAFDTKSRSLRLPASAIIDRWNQANDGRALERLEELLVRRLRIWQPDVVVTSRASPRGDEPLSHIVNQVTLRAIESAADPTRFIEHTTHAGLESWQVKKVFTAMPSGELGTVNLTTSQLATRVGKSLAGYVAPVRALIEDLSRRPQESLGYQLLVNRLTDAVGRRSFFSGIHLAHGQGARRRLVEPDAKSIAHLRSRAQLQRNLTRLFAGAEDDPDNGQRWLAQAGDMTRELEPTEAATVLHRLADRYHTSGRWELAAETMRMIVERYPNEPQAAQAARWLLFYYASSEAAWRSRGKRRGIARQVSAEVPENPSKGATRANFEADARSGEVLPGTSSNLLRRAGRAAAVGTQIARIRPDLFAQPALRFPLAAAHRHQGLPRQAQRYFQTLKLAGRSDAWANCAQAELWLDEAQGVPPLPVWNCRRANSPPYLDGRIDDAMWKNVDSVPLKLVGSGKQTTGKALLTHDNEFLYFAVTCQKARGIAYTHSKETRVRDADLSTQDHVELLLDVDRDRGTYYRFAIDHRGHCRESLWGDKTWDPNWFVARGGDDNSWVVEAAISWSDLVASAPSSKHVWAAQLQRVTPGVGFQSWSQPATPQGTPAGFGLLIFE